MPFYFHWWCSSNMRGEISFLIQGVLRELRLGFVDLDFECSTVCPTLLGLMGIWQKRLVSWARWWNTEIKVNPTQVSAHLGHPQLQPSTDNRLKWHFSQSPPGRVMCSSMFTVMQLWILFTLDCHTIRVPASTPAGSWSPGGATTPRPTPSPSRAPRRRARRTGRIWCRTPRWRRRATLTLSKIRSIHSRWSWSWSSDWSRST